MTATERLDAIDARAAAATEPPWVARRHGDHQYVSAARTSVAEVGSLFDDGGDGEVLADAEFIAHARQDIPALAGAIRDGIAHCAAEIENAGKVYSAEPYDVRAALMASSREDAARMILRAITARLGDA